MERRAPPLPGAAPDLPSPPIAAVAPCRCRQGPPAILGVGRPRRERGAWAWREVGLQAWGPHRRRRPWQRRAWRRRTRPGRRTASSSPWTWRRSRRSRQAPARGSQSERWALPAPRWPWCCGGATVARSPSLPHSRAVPLSCSLWIPFNLAIVAAADAAPAASAPRKPFPRAPGKHVDRRRCDLPCSGAHHADRMGCRVMVSHSADYLDAARRSNFCCLSTGAFPMDFFARSVPRLGRASRAQATPTTATDVAPSLANGRCSHTPGCHRPHRRESAWNGTGWEIRPTTPSQTNEQRVWREGCEKALRATSRGPEGRGRWRWTCAISFPIVAQISANGRG